MNCDDIGVVVSPIKPGLWRAKLYKMEPVNFYIDYVGIEEPTREQVLASLPCDDPGTYEQYCEAMGFDSSLLASFVQWAGVKDKYDMISLRFPELVKERATT